MPRYIINLLLPFFLCHSQIPNYKMTLSVTPGTAGGGDGNGVGGRAARGGRLSGASSSGASVIWETRQVKVRDKR